MTVATDRRRNDYIGNGLASSFDYEFKVFQDTELRVLKFLIATPEDVTGLVLNSDFTVSGVGEDEGGSVTLTAGALSALYGLSIISDLAYTQDLELANEGAYLPDSVERAFDRIEMQLQQLKEARDRTITLPETEAGSGEFSIPAEIDRAGMVLGFDADGNPIAVANVPTSGVQATPFAETLLDDTTAAQARATLGFSGVGGTVAPPNIEPLAVGTAALAALAVTSAKLAADAVITAKILDANVTPPKLSQSVLAMLGIFGGVSAVGTDSYAVNPTPAVTAYTVGAEYGWKADVANTAGATLNVSGLGAVTLVDRNGNALETGAIVAGQMCKGIYDGTNIQVITPLSSPSQFIKAWALFNGNGTPAVISGFNVSSITDNGTGDYTVNFTSPFANANYVAFGGASNNDATNQCNIRPWGISGKAVGSCRFFVDNGIGAFDAALIGIAIVGIR